MGEHLSVLELEELVAGVATPDDRSHAQTCPRCTQQLDRLRADQRLEGSVPYERAFREAAARAGIRTRSRSWVAAAIGVSLAASLAVLVVRAPAEPQERLKGGTPSLVVVNDAEDQVGIVRPHQQVSVVLTGVSDAYVGLFAVDEDGQVSSIWPARDQSARLPPGGRLPTTFEVTEGSSEVVALFAEAPFDLRDAAIRLGPAARAVPPLSEDALRAAFFPRLRWARTHLAVTETGPR